MKVTTIHRRFWSRQTKHRAKTRRTQYKAMIYIFAFWITRQSCRPFCWIIRFTNIWRSSRAILAVLRQMMRASMSWKWCLSRTELRDSRLWRKKAVRIRLSTKRHSRSLLGSTAVSTARSFCTPSQTSRDATAKRKDREKHTKLRRIRVKRWTWRHSLTPRTSSKMQLILIWSLWSGDKLRVWTSTSYKKLAASCLDLVVLAAR